MICQMDIKNRRVQMMLRYLQILTILIVGFLVEAQNVRADDMGTFKKVPLDQVCMVNNKYMAENQIVVPFEGKTYYGCCEMCVEKLQGDPKARTAIDPLTGERVDKASAFVVSKPDKKVLYFASEKNFRNYLGNPN